MDRVTTIILLYRYFVVFILMIILLVLQQVLCSGCSAPFHHLVAVLYYKYI